MVSYSYKMYTNAKNILSFYNDIKDSKIMEVEKGLILNV